MPAPDYGDGFWAYPCDAQVVVSFVFGSQTFTLDPRDMNLGQYPGDPTGRYSGGFCLVIVARLERDRFFFFFLADASGRSSAAGHPFNSSSSVGRLRVSFFFFPEMLMWQGALALLGDSFLKSCERPR